MFDKSEYKNYIFFHYVCVRMWEIERERELELYTKMLFVMLFSSEFKKMKWNCISWARHFSRAFPQSHFLLFLTPQKRLIPHSIHIVNILDGLIPSCHCNPFSALCNDLWQSSHLPLPSRPSLFSQKSKFICSIIFGIIALHLHPFIVEKNVLNKWINKYINQIYLNSADLSDSLHSVLDLIRQTGMDESCFLFWSIFWKCHYSISYFF